MYGIKASIIVTILKRIPNINITINFKFVKQVLSLVCSILSLTAEYKMNIIANPSIPSKEL